MNNVKWIIVLATLILTTTIMAFGIRSLHAHDDNLQRQVSFLCETNRVLDEVLVNAANQVDLNVKNGTYDRLVAQGLLTQENVDAAIETRGSYRRAHARLSKNRDCGEGNGR